MQPTEQSERQMIRVLLAEDHVLVREGNRQFLEEADDVKVVGEAGDGDEAVRLARKLSPDAVVMDINMPEVTGVEATRRIKDYFPDIKVAVTEALKRGWIVTE